MANQVKCPITGAMFQLGYFVDTQDACRILGYRNRSRRAYLAFMEQYNLSPKVWAKIMNYHMHEAIRANGGEMDELDGYLRRKLFWVKFGFHPKIAQLEYWELRQEYRQAHADGLTHMLPWVYKYGSIQAARKALGRSLWLVLLRLPFSRNKLIASLGQWVINVPIEKLGPILTGPLAILKALQVNVHPEMEMKEVINLLHLPAWREFILADARRLKGKGYSGALQAIDLYHDLCRMADEIGHRPRVKLKDGPRAIEDRHNELVGLYNQLMCDSQGEREPILVSDQDPRIQLEQKLKEWTGEAVPQLNLLRTRQELLEEGRVMNHCVGSYANYVANGNVAICSMVTRKGHKATVELLWNNGWWKVVQVKGPCNGPVEELNALYRAAFTGDIGLKVNLPQPKKLARAVQIRPMTSEATLYSVRYNEQEAAHLGIEDGDIPF